jgi:hypothetical protein
MQMDASRCCLSGPSGRRPGMHNAHLRMGKLTFVKQTRDTITDVSVHLNRLVAERPAEPRLATTLHLVSVFGGDQEIGAVKAAAHEGLRFEIRAPDVHLYGTLGEKPVVYRSSLQIPGRKRPVRHVVLLSKTLFETKFGSNSEARRTVMYDDSAAFVLHRLAVRFGLPVLPEWAEWFRAELERRKLIEELVGINCCPIAVKGTKLRMLRILSQGLRRHTIVIPR